MKTRRLQQQVLLVSLLQPLFLSYSVASTRGLFRKELGAPLSLELHGSQRSAQGRRSLFAWTHNIAMKSIPHQPLLLTRS